MRRTLNTIYDINNPEITATSHVEAAKAFVETLGVGNGAFMEHDQPGRRTEIYPARVITIAPCGAIEKDQIVSGTAIATFRSLSTRAKPGAAISLRTRLTASLEMARS